MIRTGAVLGLLAASGLAGPETTPAQMSRLTTAQPISAITRGEALLGLGFSYGMNQEFPLSGLAGDLVSAGRLRAAYAIADHAILILDWDARRVLSIDELGPSEVPLEAGVDDGRTEDSGDARLGLSYAPFALGAGMVGGWMAVELPNSDERKGIGTNTTKFFVGPVASFPWAGARLTGRVGLGILEAPGRPFVQDDVLVYSLEALLSARNAVRVLVGVQGQYNPRRTVSPGAEDLGTAMVGLDWAHGPWRLDASLEKGFAIRSPDWRVGLGVAWTRPGG